MCHEASQSLKEPILDLFQMLFINLFSLQKKTFISYDDAEMFTSEVHDPYARTTGAWK